MENKKEKSLNEFSKDANGSDRDSYWNDPEVFKNSDYWLDQIKKGEIKVEPVLDPKAI
jgi:hypothetical protein